jgi:hypothetical protein
MGVLDRFKNSDDSGNGPDAGSPAPTEKRELTEEEREQIIEDARSKLPELDKQLEENLSRLRDLSRS